MKQDNAIRVQRAIKGYSQEYMASRLNISQNAYSKIERGETELSVKRIYEIAEILDISIYRLLPDVKSSASIDPSGVEWLFSKSCTFVSGLFR